VLTSSSTHLNALETLQQDPKMLSILTLPLWYTTVYLSAILTHRKGLVLLTQFWFHLLQENGFLYRIFFPPIA